MKRDRLDECGLKKDPGDYPLMGGVITLVAAVAGFVMGGLFSVVLLTLLTPLVLHLLLKFLTGRRRGQFGQQVPPTLQMFPAVLGPDTASLGQWLRLHRNASHRCPRS